MIIRQEEVKDYSKVFVMVEKAFQSAEHSDSNEHNLVEKLRKSEAFIPELSLVAEEDNEIIGHILFTKAKVGEHTLLALAPLSVLPQNQKQGIGKALIQKGHESAKELGYTHSIVLGSEIYYPKFGYKPASLYGIKAPFDVPDMNFMAINLVDDAPKVEGILEYAKEFFE